MANTNNMINTLLCSYYTVFFFIVASTQFPTLSAFPTTTTNETDLLALLSIKNHIKIDPSQFLDSWNDSLHFCDWQGITCGKRHNRVTVLNVSSLDLVGTLSPSIGNLTFLREIYLYENSFHGAIPPEIGSLFRMRSLVFENNSFQGHIPANITLCKNLRYFFLDGNKLSGRIPDQLNALSNLLQLALDKNNFIGSIPPSLGNISTLEFLDLSTNNLTGNIPHELGKLVHLQFLELGENYLSGSIPPAIYNISSIRVFGIILNNLTGQFPDSLGLTLPKMTVFEAYSNNLSGSIPSTLANASDLTIIEIGENMLTGTIPRNLGRLQHLRSLQFPDNPLLGIDTDNDISFITTLTNCTNLEELDLSGIQIGGILPPEISNLSRKLTIFGLYDNHISGYLPEGIGELVGLNTLHVYNNNLSGSIPLSIGKLINMKELHLNDNKFIGEIPPSIGDMSGLLILELQQNMLTGSIPLSFSNLTQLQQLVLSQNRLNGSLPKEVFSMTSLLLLVLRQNNFTGSLPSEVGNLKNLISLDVSENEIFGEIPKSIVGCLMLEYLYMEGNFLNGTIPSSLGQLKSIEIMDLSRNKLSGEIPASLEKLKFISLLNLSFNILEGGVPKNGVFANATALSIVGNERLCGGIKSLNLPECPPNGKLSTHIIIILVICILIALLSLFGCTYAIYQTRKSKRVPSSTSAYDKQLLQISYAEILTSTDGFSSENLIGEGKYGSVYRGVLKPSEKVVAVKVLKLQLKGAHKSFLAECEALRNIRHINLAKIITSCSSIDFKGNDFKALILEYVPNGSLEEWLHQNPSIHGDEKKLGLLQRLNIAIDIATALDYLHNHSGNPIVHCDIKPSNVLLGDDLRGLVSDFGLAKFLPTTNDIESTSIGIRGTIGYVAPEYGMGGNVSPKGDIYSFGIILLEMFTGKRPTNTMFTEDFTLHNYVKTAFHDRVAEIIDPRLLTVEAIEEIKSNNTSTRNIESSCLSIFRVGVSCSSEMQNERMDIKDALIELQHIRNKM